MRNLLNHIIQIGIEKDQESWRKNMIRKVNSYLILAILNTFLGLFLFTYLNQQNWIIACCLVLLISPSIIILNFKHKHIAATYIFLLIGAVFICWLTEQLGIDSHLQFFYFPLLVTVVQLLGKKELLVHMFIIAGIYFIALVYNNLNPTYMKDSGLSKDYFHLLNLFCVFLSFASCIVVIVSITLENSRQERKIKKIVKEKEVLLAEVFHRVKNNMTIVTSLISLRKNASSSYEVQEALEDCRSRVFSMALIHREMLSAQNIGELNFKEFIEKLVDNIGYSMGEMANLSLQMDSVTLELNPDKAVPCGLILNELITNAFKHAHAPNKPLKITVSMHVKDNMVLIKVMDNGEGIGEKKISNSDALGMDLFESLCEQIDAKYEIESTSDGTTIGFSFHT